MSRPSTSPFAQVVSAIRGGETPRAAAARLGLTLDFAEAVIEEARRLGLVTTFRDACATCAGPVNTIACAGCPLLQPKGV